MKSRKQFFLILLLIIIVFVLSGCKGEKIANDNVISEYHKRIEEVKIENLYEDNIYV